MNRTHKLHAIFSEKSKAQAAMELMMKSGVFRRDQLFLVEVPGLVDTENARVRTRGRSLVEFLRPLRLAAFAGGILLVGAVSHSTLHGVGLQGAAVPLIVASAIIGAYAGLLGGWMAFPHKCNAASGLGRSGGANWVLIVHAHGERDTTLAEELLSSARLPSKLRIPRKGMVGRPTEPALSEPVPVSCPNRRA